MTHSLVEVIENVYIQIITIKLFGCVTHFQSKTFHFNHNTWETSVMFEIDSYYFFFH